ncbi:hypothetical protein G7066_00655 [Leucobacter coleopterorum]|uniref:Uncharacterized protein n=1 Tax=Leucobacter coleopterorum TaxID=2714933 RepID=A0ABX6JTH4_9MICO|nr:hypothetical protein [Leucobacter coleopterorum]QIM17589.1 hypothetical protein G7066_00655 [Leucobacter coleopterorum]
MALGQWLMSGLPESVPLILRAFVLTLVIVPLAVYVGVPFVTKTLTRILPSLKQVSAP